MKLTRRDILKLTGGSALGLLLSPLPWKLLDDTSVWSQNWGLIPKLSRGPVSTKFSFCTLCSGGCAVRARCVDGLPFALHGANHPISNGILCPRGIVAHHSAYHPLRIEKPFKFQHNGADAEIVSVTTEQAQAEISKHLQKRLGSVVFFDRRTGRTQSSIYRQFSQKFPDAFYCSADSAEDATLFSLRQMTQKADISFGYDFEHTAMIVNFDAPLLEGWGTPGRMHAVMNKRKETGLKFIQVGTTQTRTALQADRWLAIAPESEKSLALSLASVLLRENLYVQRAGSAIIDLNEYKAFVSLYEPEKIAAQIGIPADQIMSLAREMASSPSCIVVGGADPASGSRSADMEKAIAGLNVLLGAIGRQGGIVERKAIGGTDQKPAIQWNEIPDASVQILILDSEDNGYAMPWEVLRRKLIPNGAVVIAFASILDNLAAHADYVLPVPAAFEEPQEVSAPTGSAVEIFALAPALLPKRSGIDRNDFLAGIAKVSGYDIQIPPLEELWKQKAHEIFKTKRGTLVSSEDGTMTKVSAVTSAEDLLLKIKSGMMWIDDTSAKKRTFVFALKKGLDNKSVSMPQYEGSLILIPDGVRGETSAAKAPIMMSKLYQESHLRENAGIIRMNPKTAAAKGIEERQEVLLRTQQGSMKVSVKLSQTVRPGVVEASAGPQPNSTQNIHTKNETNILDLCNVRSDGTWRTTKAEIVRL
jgi:formylmethanofuran dehydrogenase subunit D